MKESIIKRVEEIERRCKPDRLMILCKTTAGEEVLTVSEYIRRDAVFLRVVGGSDLRDLDEILFLMEKNAQEYS